MVGFFHCDITRKGGFFDGKEAFQRRVESVRLEAGRVGVREVQVATREPSVATVAVWGFHR
jgi:hypothetical protein